MGILGHQKCAKQKLGYWSDNGATYYYKFDASLGYEGTLLAIRDEFFKKGVPLGYLQLDSWFYSERSEGRVEEI